MENRNKCVCGDTCTVRHNKNVLTRLVVALGLGLAAVSACADHPAIAFGSEASGPINTIGATPLPAGSAAVGIRNEYIERDQFSDARLAALAESGIEDVHSVDSINSASISLGYGLTDDLSVSIRLPFVSRHDIREGELEHGEAEAHPHGDTSGLGDLVALGSYRFYSSENVDAAIQAGFKAPTGDTDEADRGSRLETEFQPGSGSWDFIIGAALSRTHGKIGLHANVLANISSEGSQDTEFGDALFYNVAAVYPILGETAHGHDDAETSHAHFKLDAMLEVNGETRWKNDVGGTSEPNSGGTVVYLSPGLRLSHGKVGAFVSAGVPIIDDSKGVQTDIDIRLVGGIGIAF